jgi:hypothetical protein
LGVFSLSLELEELEIELLVRIISTCNSGHPWRELGIIIGIHGLEGAEVLHGANSGICVFLGLKRALKYTRVLAIGQGQILRRRHDLHGQLVA